MEKVKLRKKNILIIPPTSAICWYFSCHEWLKDLLNILKHKLNSKLFSNIKIRFKPNEPLVDINEIFLELETLTISVIQVCKKI